MKVIANACSYEDTASLTIFGEDATENALLILLGRKVATGLSLYESGAPDSAEASLSISFNAKSAESK